MVCSKVALRWLVARRGTLGPQVAVSKCDRVHRCFVCVCVWSVARVCCRDQRLEE